MNKLLLPILAALMMFCGCGKQENQQKGNTQQENPQWEYMVLSVEGSKLPTACLSKDEEALIEASNFKARQFNKNGSYDWMLNSWGKEGWELVDVYTTIETVFPNFGGAEYHTGVKSNTRTDIVNFVFKRKLKSGETAQSK